MGNLEYRDYLKGTAKVLKTSQKEKKPYEVTVSGKKFVVFPNVFSPKYFRDTKLFADNLPIKEGEEVLEIGPGTGIVSIFAALRDAKKILSIDVNRDAVRNAQENITRHKLQDKVEVRLGSLYDPLKPNEKFDVIFWNTPFGLTSKENITDLAKAIYDVGYKSTERFIKEAPKYLKENGKLFIGFSSTLGRLDLIKKFTREAGFTLKLIFKRKSSETHPVYFEIFEAKLKK